MALVNKFFWSIAAIEALFFAIAFVLTANQRGQNPNGGKGMALLFQIVVPFLILAIVSLVFWKTNSSALHIVLLVAVIVPVAVLAGQWIRGPLMDRYIAVGGYLYEDSKMKKFVGAVANLNVQSVRELAPGVDVNVPGENGVTPLKFAVEKVDTSGDTPEVTAARIDMIRVLLSVGAKPDSALPNACQSNNGGATGVLLAAGANPNYKDEKGTPAFFSCLSARSGGLESLRLLAAKGADFNALDAEGVGILIRAATFSEWEVMMFFLERGVKDTARLNRKNAAAMVSEAIEDDKQNSRAISPALAALAAKFNH